VLELLGCFYSEVAITFWAELEARVLDLVDAELAVDRCAILVVAQHRGAWNVVAVKAAEVLNQCLEDGHFPLVVGDDFRLSDQIIFGLLVKHAESVFLFGVAEMAPFQQSYCELLAAEDFVGFFPDKGLD